MIQFEVNGLTELRARLAQLSPDIRAAVRPYIAQATSDLRERVKTNIAQRFRSAGPLYNSVAYAIDEDIEPGAPTNGSITGRVFTQDIPYAAIQEYGGTTSAHEILPVNGKALAFMMPGKMQFKGSSQNGMVFARKVNHPGSRIPERSYARTALASFRAPFQDGIRQVVQQALFKR